MPRLLLGAVDEATTIVEGALTAKEEVDAAQVVDVAEGGLGGQRRGGVVGRDDAVDGSQGVARAHTADDQFGANEEHLGAIGDGQRAMTLQVGEVAVALLVRGRGDSLPLGVVAQAIDDVGVDLHVAGRLAEGRIEAVGRAVDVVDDLLMAFSFLILRGFVPLGFLSII